MQTNLTSGKIGKSIILFSLPLLAGDIIQQCYNLVDTLVVGQGIGSTALAAVGSAFALMGFLTSVIRGLCMGSGVVFSHHYGAKEINQMKTSIFNAFVFIAIVTLGIFGISFFFLDLFLNWIQTPPEVLEMTKIYLSVILFGMIFIALYNFIAAIFRSVGNTMMPLIFLAVACVVNIILDVIFVMYFHLGVAGAAWATLIAQGLSALGITLYFFYKAQELCPKKSHCYFDKMLLKNIMDNSILTAIQQSIMNFGILTVHGLVNSFGYSVSAAFAVCVKIDTFAYMPASDFGNAVATFVAQNKGAKKPQRIRDGFTISLRIVTVISVIISIFVFFFAQELMLIFVPPQDIEIISIGVGYLHIVGVTYIGVGILLMLYGFYRGLGKAKMSIILTLISLGTRVALSFSLSTLPTIGIKGIWFAIPMGWFLADCFGLFYYNKYVKNTFLSYNKEFL